MARVGHTPLPVRPTKSPDAFLTAHVPSRGKNVIVMVPDRDPDSQVMNWSTPETVPISVWMSCEQPRISEPSVTTKVPIAPVLVNSTSPSMVTRPVARGCRPRLCLGIGLRFTWQTGGLDQSTPGDVAVLSNGGGESHDSESTGGRV